MNAQQIMDHLYSYGAQGNYARTCDTLKAGDALQEVTKIAVAMFATVDVVRRAHAWGAQLLVVHEPTYYDHWDGHCDEPIENEKRQLIEQSGMALYRFHDHPHFEYPDIISTGMVQGMALPGEVVYSRDTLDLTRITLHTPMTPVQVARQLEERLGIRHMRICGARDALCTHISGMFGTPDGVMEELQREETEILLTGEACEWNLAEYARDAALLGRKKALLIMGHIGSEAAGMVYTAQLLEKQFPQLQVQYFDCGEVYTYTDD